MCLFHKSVVNLYISYKLDKWSKDLDTDFTLGSCLFGAVKLSKDTDPDKYEYSGYGNGFDSRSQFSRTCESNEKNAIIFGFQNSSPVRIDNRNKNSLVLSEGSTQGLEDATITVEAEYPINFTESGKIFVLSLNSNGSNSFLFVNTVKVGQLRAKDSEIKLYPVCLGNISKDFTLNNIKKTGLKGNIKDFSVDYDPMKNSDIIDIHRFLMKDT